MIYLHIGTSKTGTTTIQRSLVSNRDLLYRQGFLYPEQTIYHWGHHNLYYEVSNNKLFKPEFGAFKELLEAIKEFKQERADGNVILSSETFCGALPHELEHIIEGLRTLDEVKIIVYYRRQDLYLRSFWSMYSGQGKIKMPFEQWALDCIDKNRYSLYYDRQVKKFERLVGEEQIKLLTYDDISRDVFFKVFLKTVGVVDLSQIENPVREYNHSARVYKIENQNIIDICKEKYHQSNLKLARKYLKREQLFSFKPVNA